MKALKIYIALLFVSALFVQCSRDEEEDLYQVFYESPENLKLDEDKFEVSPSEISSRFTDFDTVRFSYVDKSIVQTLNWEITLTHYSIKGTSITGDSVNAINTFNIPVAGTSIPKEETFWTIQGVDGIEFSQKDSINVSLTVIGSNSVVNGSTIKFIR